VCILLTAIVIRLGQFGNPIAGLDDQFYLLVGDRIWSGALPYTDIWDRKPAGLFVVYAAIRALPGDGVLAYQLVGTLFLALTGVAVARISAAVVPPLAALAAGVAVVTYGVLLGAGFGEAPVFYDLLTVIAGACVLAVRAQPRAVRLDVRAAAAMLLCGVALTLKTSAVFESCCFGLLLLLQDRRGGASVAVRLMRAAVYLALGLAPTLLIALFYAANGGWEAFVFANLQSAFLRTGGATRDSLARLAGMLILLSPLILPAAAEWRHIPRDRREVLGAWLLAGLLSFVAIGRCYEHYALPLVAPLALTAAYGFRRRGVVVPFLALATIAGGALAVNSGEHARQDRADFTALLEAVPREVKTGCLFVYEGPTMLYHLSGACLPGRYVFPGHFTEPEEDGALEYPMADILKRTLAQRPAVIVSVPELREGGEATENDRTLRRELTRAYAIVARQDIRLYGTRRVEAVVWRRKGLASQRKL
jgi:hypothetical protein